jgi:hypothetical protein
VKVIKKNVYYCDFCKKKSLRSLKNHEKHCTGNPDRECRLCETSSIREIINKYRKYIKVIESKPDEFGMITGKVEYKKEFTLQDIINELDYKCPNCILTILRCVGLNRFYFGNKYKFDYKKALGEWWGEVIDEQRRKDEHEAYYGY